MYISYIFKILSFFLKVFQKTLHRPWNVLSKIPRKRIFWKTKKYKICEIQTSNFFQTIEFYGPKALTVGGYLRYRDNYPLAPYG